MKINYLHTMVRVRDIEESKKFYCDLLGLVETRRKDLVPAKATLVFLSPEGGGPGSEVELTYNWDSEEAYTGGRNFGHLAYEVENIYEKCQQLMDGGVTINRPPRDGRMAFVVSPDGISIELLQIGDPLPPQEPWGVDGKHRFLVIVARLLACLIAAAAPAGAAAQCRAALVMGIDVSSSVDADEYALQMTGLADALQSPEVAEAILGGPGGGVMAAAFSWSGAWNQTLIVDWTWLGDHSAIAGFAGRLDAAPRDAENWPTAMGRATEFAAGLHRRNPVDCRRRVVDISGDGVNNHGVGPEWYRARGDFDGLTINGLVILGAVPDPLAYYRDRLIHGPGAFVEIADSFRDYPRAIRRKLLRELSAGPVAMVRP